MQQSSAFLPVLELVTPSEKDHAAQQVGIIITNLK